MEENEILPDGLKRELFEEFGVNAEIGNLLYIREILDEHNNSIEFFFTVNNPKIFREIDMDNASAAYEIESFSFFEIRPQALAIFRLPEVFIILLFLTRCSWQTQSYRLYVP